MASGTGTQLVARRDAAKLWVMAQAEGQVRWLMRWGVLLLAGAAAVIVLIASGAFDPKLLGPKQWSQALGAEYIPSQSRQIQWLKESTPHASYTIRLTAAHQSGEVDAGYGLVIGQDAHYLAIAVSPLGYVAIWQEEAGIADPASSYAPFPSTFFVPWQTWPHVLQGGAMNELWVDVVDGRVTVRINRELLWSGEIADVSGEVGVLGESFGGAAVVDFQKIELFATAAK
ncbi:MAG: hypothetical protein ACE5E7_04025 [Anaerolineae bacterium]